MASERALRSITRLHARSSTARGWFGLAAARQARDVVVSHSVAALPFYHSREALSRPNFQLCAFPLEKVSASLRAARAISQRQGAYKRTIVVLLANKIGLLYNGTYCTTLCSRFFLRAQEYIRARFLFQEEREHFGNFCKNLA